MGIRHALILFKIEETRTLGYPYPSPRMSSPVTATAKNDATAMDIDLSDVVVDVVPSQSVRAKVKNAFMYFRWAFAFDASFRNTYLSPKLLDVLEDDMPDDFVGSVEEKMMAMGQLLWVIHLTKAQKLHIRERYIDWAAQNTASAAPAQ